MFVESSGTSHGWGKVGRQVLGRRGLRTLSCWGSCTVLWNQVRVLRLEHVLLGLCFLHNLERPRRLSLVIILIAPGHRWELLGGFPFSTTCFTHSESAGLHPPPMGERSPAILEGDLWSGGAIISQWGAHGVAGVGRDGNSFSLPLSHTHQFKNLPGRGLWEVAEGFRGGCSGADVRA